MLNGIEVRPLRRALKHINKKSYSNLSKFVHRKIFSIIGLYLFGKKIIDCSIVELIFLVFI